jgi:acylphosphatase
MKSYKFIISGKVQGVYYRRSVLSKALTAKFSGYVKNLPNKSVEAVVTCEPERLDTFISILKVGSVNCVVKNIKQFEINDLYEGDFTIDNS